MDVLPFVLLGRRVAFQPDMGASASEMTFGKNVTIPGEILCDPESVEGIEAHKKLLNLVKNATNREICQPSNHAKAEPRLKGLPEGTTHVYTKQHQATGLQSHFEGPFEIAEKVSNSVIKINVGSYKDGRIRYEYRHLNEIKPAHPKSLASPMQRPKLGRPAQSPSSPADSRITTDAKTPMVPDPIPFPQPPSTGRVDTSKQTQSIAPSVAGHETSHSDGRAHLSNSPETRENSNPVISPDPPSRPVRSTRNPKPYYVDAIWTASPADLDALNRAINSKVKMPYES